MRVNVVKVDLTAPGIHFKLTAPSGTKETVRQTTLEFLEQEHAQVAINAHFFLPFPSEDLNCDLIGLAASEGKVYSAFETPKQSYALIPNAPAINIDAKNHATVVTSSTLEKASLWNTVSGSAQIVTSGVKTIPTYGSGQLTTGGPRNYSDTNSWYDLRLGRTAIGITRDGAALVLLAVDHASVGEIADVLIRDYDVSDALNLDGGGSTTLAMHDPATGRGKIVNVSSDNPKGRKVGSNLAVFATSLSADSRDNRSSSLQRSDRPSALPSPGRD